MVGQAVGAALVALHDAGDLFAERLPRAAEHRADQAPDPHRRHDPPSIHRHVRDHPPVEAMHPPRRLPAHRARHRIVPGPRRHPDNLALVRHALDDQGRQSRKHHTHKLIDIAHTMPTTAVTLRYHRLRARAVNWTLPPWHDSAFAREMVAVMTVGATPGSEVVLETSRLLLRPWRVAEAVVQRELWTERDPRVPPHRRIDADGHPTVAELEDSIRTNQLWSIGLLAVERKASRDVIGYCGLVDSGRGSVGEPELAFELLRRVWCQGYATEASLAVLEWARSSGFERLWATVWDWNTASRRVLAKVGFTETERKEVDAVYGTTLFTTRRL